MNSPAVTIINEPHNVYDQPSSNTGDNDRRSPRYHSNVALNRYHNTGHQEDHITSPSA